MLPAARRSGFVSERLDGAVHLLAVVDAPHRIHRLAHGFKDAPEAGDVVSARLDILGITEPRPHLRKRFEVRRIGVRVGPPRHRDEALELIPHAPFVEKLELGLLLPKDLPPSEWIVRATLRSTSSRSAARRQPVRCRPRPPGGVGRRRARRADAGPGVVSTRVLPDPAGATTRAGPEAWETASSWSGASPSASGSVGVDCGVASRARPTRRGSRPDRGPEAVLGAPRRSRRTSRPEAHRRRDRRR